MNNIRREKVGSEATVASSTAAAKGQFEGEQRESVMARLLLLRELAQILPEREEKLLGEGVSEIGKPIEEEEEETLRTALASMILSIEESTVKLAEFHSSRTDNSVEMSKGALADIDRTWDEMMDNFEKADRILAKMKKMAGIMKVVSKVVVVCAVVATGLTMGAGAALTVAALSVAQPYMDKAVAGLAAGLEQIGIPKSFSNTLATVVIVGGSMMAGAAAAKVANMTGKVAISATNAAVNVGVAAYVGTGGVITTMVVDIMREAGESEKAIMYTEMVLGMAEGMAAGIGAAGSNVMKNLSSLQTSLLYTSLVGGMLGAVAQSSMGVAQGISQQSLGDTAEERGRIEADMQLLEMSLKMGDDTLKAQTNHQRGLTQAREAMTQTYGTMMAGAWKAVSHIIK